MILPLYCNKDHAIIKLIVDLINILIKDNAMTYLQTVIIMNLLGVAAKNVFKDIHFKLMATIRPVFLFLLTKQIIQVIYKKKILKIKIL